MSNSPGTSHAVTADASGMAVSMTSTINLSFGSQVMVPETGLILNNEMNDFSVPNSTDAFGYVPSSANFIYPGKRPLSSITPMIVEHLANSTLYFLTGAAGGSHIITATLQVLWHALDWKMDSVQALLAPRFHDQLMPNSVSFLATRRYDARNGIHEFADRRSQVEFEYAYNNETSAFIEGKGLAITWAGYLSKAQALRKLPNGTFEVATDQRFPSGGGFAV